MADPLGRAVAGTPFRPSAGAWNRMLEAARSLDSGAGVPRGVDVPHCLVRVRNDTGGDLAAFSVLALGASILDITVPLRVSPTPMFEGTTPAATTDAFAVLIEPAPDGKFALAAIAGVTPVEVNVTDAAHEYATPTASSAARLTSASSGPARILDRESGTGNVSAVVSLGGRSSSAPAVYHTTAQWSPTQDCTLLLADPFLATNTVDVPAGTTVLVTATLWYHGVTDTLTQIGVGSWQASGSVPARPDLYGATSLTAFIGSLSVTNIVMPIQGVFTVGSTGGDQRIGAFRTSAGTANLRVVGISAVPVA